MRSKIICAALIVLLAGCASYVQTGTDVTIKEPESEKERIALAERVIAALPAERVREQVHQRFPELSDSELKCINVSYSVMEFQDQQGHVTGREVHLWVLLLHRTERLHSMDGQILEFARGLVREELARQADAKPINTVEPTRALAGARGSP